MILADDLRKAVLQAAIQGKLVEQRPEEGTGADLYVLIQEEKSTLVKQGKVKREQPLPEIKEDEIPFDIPDSWMWVRFKDLTLSSSTGPFGTMLHKDEYIIGGVPVINPTNLVNGVIVPDEKVTVSNTTAQRLSSYKLTVNNLVLARRGEMGRCAIVGQKEDGWLCGTGSFFVDLSKEIHAAYIYELFQTPYVRARLPGSSVGTTMSNLNQKILSMMIVPLPPKEEQKRIVDKIHDTLAKVSEYAMAEQDLVSLRSAFPDDMRKSILQYAMQGKLVEQRTEEGTGEELYRQIQSKKNKLVEAGIIKKEKSLPEIMDSEIPFDIPESWKWVRLNDIVSKTIKRGKSPTYTTKSSSVHVFAQKCNVKNGGIDLSLCQLLDESVLGKYPNEEFMVDNDIVINSTGTGTLGRVGIYSLADNQEEKLLVPDSHVTVVHLVDKVYSPYIYYIICNYQKYLEGKGSGSTKQKELKPDVIKALLIPLPPLQEQKRIAEKLNQILPLIEGLREEI